MSDNLDDVDVMSTRTGITTETLADGRVVITISEGHRTQVVIVTAAMLEQLRERLGVAGRRRWRFGGTVVAWRHTR